MYQYGMVDAALRISDRFIEFYFYDLEVEGVWTAIIDIHYFIISDKWNKSIWNGMKLVKLVETKLKYSKLFYSSKNRY